MKFSDIIGQEYIKPILIRSVDEHRISHAQLFLGNEGSGTLAMALAYAQYINCENKQNGDSCGTCPSCIKMAKLIHPDVHFVFPTATTTNHPKKPISKEFYKEWREIIEKNQYFSLFDWYAHIGIDNKQGIINADDCNEINKILSLKTYEAEYKIMIIWMIEKLYYSAAPKLLKILEEPPPKTLFIAIAESKDQILNTILSRMQALQFNRFKNQDIRQWLQRYLQTDEARAQKIATQSQGNLNLAQKIHNENNEDEQLFQEFVQWMRHCYGNKIVEINQWVNQIAGVGRERQKIFLNLAARVIREALLFNLKLPELLKVSTSENEFVQKFSPFIHQKNIPYIYEEIQKAVFHIERNVNAKLVFMDLSLKFSKLLRMSSNG